MTNDKLLQLLINTQHSINILLPIKTITLPKYIPPTKVHILLKTSIRNYYHILQSYEISIPKKYLLALSTHQLIKLQKLVSFLIQVRSLQLANVFERKSQCKYLLISTSTYYKLCLQIKKNTYLTFILSDFHNELPFLKPKSKHLKLSHALTKDLRRIIHTKNH